MSERKTFLRILYTIDGSIQYILARSLTPVSITFISREEDLRATLPNGSRVSALYASVSLKTCLETIRRSSPELMQDPTLDYSLYVLDPLESNSAPAPVNISNTHGDTTGLNKGATEQPGVAVGLGLMSWALMSSDRDSICVTGTLGKQHTGQETLEVVFALRKTLAVKERAWDVPSLLQPPFGSQESITTETSNQVSPHWYPTSHGSYRTSSSTNLSRSVSTPNLTRETVASIQLRSKAKTKAPKAARYSNTPVTESDKLMSADTYIGPLKKKGRPKSTNAGSRPIKTRGHCTAPSQVVAQKEVIVLDASDNENDVSSSQAPDAAAKKKTSQQLRPPPFTTAPLIRHQSQQIVTDLQVKTEKSEGTLPDLLSLLSSASADSTASKAALLATLSTIDSTQSHSSLENPQNAALIAALKQLLAIYTQPSASSKPTTPEATIRHHLPISSSSHSDGIVILDKENVNPTVSRKCHGKNGLDKFSDPLPFALNSSKERSIQSLRPSTRTNEIDLANVSKETAISTIRKRTLSDFMDERESGRKTKGKDRETIKRHDARRDSGLQRSETLPAPDGLRHYPKILVANLPRPGQPVNYYRTPSDPWTSPARERPDNAENDKGSGSSSKRLSPRKHQAISASSPIRGKDARKKYVVPEWARTNTATMPRLSEEASRAMEEAEARKREERNAARRKLPTKRCKTKPGDSSDTTVEQLKLVEQPSRPQFVIGRNCGLSQGPISASSDGPVIAFPLVSAARPSSPPLLPVLTRQTPKTPSKSLLQSIAGEEDGSLFTPIAAGGSLFGSAASRGSIRGTPPSYLTSPLGNRKKVRISPTKSGSGTSLPMWSSSSSPKASADSVVSEEHSNSNSGKEAEESLDDFDCPPGSLPIASSDVDWSYSQSTGESGGDIDDDGGERTVKQHWAGLPPSSPPAPSSPMLVPEIRTDDEDMDLPIATSDSEVDDMNMFDLDGPSPNAALTAERQRPMDLTNADFTSLFSVERDASFFPLSSSTTLDLFEQFTNLNAQSDDILVAAASNDDVQTMFQNGIGNLDFTEFWETFKPMVDENTQPFQEDGLTGFFGMENTQTLHGDVDHGKLAGEIQSLLGGFLV